MIDLRKPVNTTTKENIFMLNIICSPEKDCILAHRRALVKFICAIKSAGPTAVVTLYKDLADRSNSYFYYYKKNALSLPRATQPLLLTCRSPFLKAGYKWERQHS